MISATPASAASASGRSSPCVSEIKPIFMCSPVRRTSVPARGVILDDSPSMAHGNMPSRAYLLSLPERVIRSALGLSAGLLREVGEVALPRSMRRSHLYRSLVDVTLRYVIEQVGGAKGVYPAAEPQADDFLARRGAGHVVELLGIAAFRLSPVWVLAAL